MSYTIEVTEDAALAWYLAGWMLGEHEVVRGCVPDSIKDGLNQLSDAFQKAIPAGSEEFAKLMVARDAKLEAIRAFEGDVVVGGNFW